MTGYSRAGTISDLTGVYINNHLGEFNTPTDDLYIYNPETQSSVTLKDWFLSLDGNRLDVLEDSEGVQYSLNDNSSKTIKFLTNNADEETMNDSIVTSATGQKIINAHFTYARI